MSVYEQRVSIFEFLCRTPGAVLQDVPEPPETLEGLIREVFDEHHRSADELRQQVTALETRNKELEAYAHMVAHDLKQPLAVLILTAEMMDDPHLPIAELKESLQQIRSTSDEMKNIINSLLLLAEVSKAEAPLESVRMEHVVQKVQKRLSHMIRQREAQIVIPQAWPQAIGYGPWLEEVWMNYLSNAINYGGSPPRVELGASACPDGMLRFWTRDNGLGIPPVSMKQLFTPFTQLSHHSDRGQGLGLSIVQKIIEKLGGEVGVESEVGQGSLFFFTLPAPRSSSALNLTQDEPNQLFETYSN